MDRAGADDDELGGEPAARRRRWPSTASRRCSSTSFRRSCSCCRPRWSSAELASGWKGGVYNWVADRHLEADGLPRRVVPVRDDDLLLSDPARVRREHARLRDQPGARQQRRVDRARDHGLLLVRRVHLVSRHQGRRGAGQRRPHHRHADPGRDPGHPRRRLPRSGQPVCGADDRREPAAPVGGPRQPRADREQLPVLQRHGDERGARLVDAQPRQRVPEGDVPRDGPGAADLHPPGARDQLDRARRRALTHGRGDAGLRHGASPHSGGSG